MGEDTSVEARLARIEAILSRFASVLDRLEPLIDRFETNPATRWAKARKSA